MLLLMDYNLDVELYRSVCMSVCVFCLYPFCWIYTPARWLIPIYTDCTPYEMMDQRVSGPCFCLWPIHFIWGTLFVLGSVHSPVHWHIHKHTPVYAHTDTHTRTHIHTHTHTHARMHTHTHAHTYTHAHTHTHTHTHAHTHIHTHPHIHTHTHTHTHTRTHTYTHTHAHTLGLGRSFECFVGSKELHINVVIFIAAAYSSMFVSSRSIFVCHAHF